MTPELGTIEGFYGRPWSWESRKATISFLAPHGYRFYFYAPKGDEFLRRRWQEPHPAEAASNLAALATHCQGLGVRFGVGLSPFEVYIDFGAAAREALVRKLGYLDELGVQDLAVLFDDMRGDTPDLAERQIEILAWIRKHTGAERLFFCPTYYSDDPVLDRVFGYHPDQYLEKIGVGLDPAVHVFWTGEEICAKEISVGDLQRVGGILRRKPFLWDNYPVNDTQRMSLHLHIRGFTGRPAAIGEHLAGHAMNPALQPVLTRIPALTLAESYRVGSAYRYGDAFRRAANDVLGEDLGALVREDLLTLQDVGLDRLDPAKVAELTRRYAVHDHEGAREIVAWLGGAYRITDAAVIAQ